MTDLKPWTHRETTVLARTPIFTLNAHQRASETLSLEAEFYVLDVPDWVNVVAVTEDDKVVLVEQYRHGTQHMTIEIPGGMVDPEDVGPEHAARRELLEETGFASDDWQLIGAVEPNPAIQINRCFTYLARGAKRIAEPAPDGLEELRVHEVPAVKIREMLRDGEIEHALVVAAFMWWSLVE